MHVRTCWRARNLPDQAPNGNVRPPAFGLRAQISNAECHDAVVARVRKRVGDGAVGDGPQARRVQAYAQQHAREQMCMLRRVCTCACMHGRLKGCSGPLRSTE